MKIKSELVQEKKKDSLTEYNVYCANIDQLAVTNKQERENVVKQL